MSQPLEPTDEEIERAADETFQEIVIEFLQGVSEEQLDAMTPGQRETSAGRQIAMSVLTDDEVAEMSETTLMAIEHYESARRSFEKIDARHKRSTADLRRVRRPRTQSN